ncbi:hypothetical protein ACVIHI_008614 [Bradyrhizobium sp. USDA 4524]|nr:MULTISPECIES: IS3 family transposase [unclassified Bradyrhizobium]MCP1845922.1 hypothetical protein [Bradyrhizobium sp. USDA 4538]MCP1907444.1 hypothetical protein [Bradyrhizobium sp. USDA 4537]MCP1985230.1 hypothetical protein [Bradyrhizobium sp. USDA 4539]
MRFPFIEDRRADYPVALLCDVLGVSPAGYYAWRSRPESRRSAANRDLVDDIRRVYRDTRGRYGSPRIHVELKARGRGASRGRIERLMRRHGIRALMATPRRVRTTDSCHDFPIAPNLLKRNFIATAPNQIWLADITYVEIDQGWLYLATVLADQHGPARGEAGAVRGDFRQPDPCAMAERVATCDARRDADRKSAGTPRHGHLECGIVFNDGDVEYSAPHPRTGNSAPCVGDFPSTVVQQRVSLVTVAEIAPESPRMRPRETRRGRQWTAQLRPRLSGTPQLQFSAVRSVAFASIAACRTTLAAQTPPQRQTRVPCTVTSSCRVYRKARFRPSAPASLLSAPPIRRRARPRQPRSTLRSIAQNRPAVATQNRTSDASIADTTKRNNFRLVTLEPKNRVRFSLLRIAIVNVPSGVRLGH